MCCWSLVFVLRTHYFSFSFIYVCLSFEREELENLDNVICFFLFVYFVVSGKMELVRIQRLFHLNVSGGLAFCEGR